MLIALIALSLLLTASLCLNAHLWAARQYSRVLLRKQERAIRRAVRVAERWQDATLKARHMTPVNFPLPPRPKTQNVPMVARTPEEARERHRAQRDGVANEVSNGNGVLSERQKLDALKAAEDFTKGKQS